MADIYSRPYHPNEKMCCSGCVWGRGEHAEWCLKSFSMENFRAALEVAQKWMVAPGAAGHWSSDEAREEFDRDYALVDSAISAAREVEERQSFSFPLASRLRLTWRDRDGTTHTRILDNIAPGDFIEVPVDADLSTVEYRGV